MEVFCLYNTIFLFITKTEDRLYYPALLNTLIFVLNHLLIRSDIGELGLLTETLKHFQRTWVISLLHIPFIKFFAVRELILYQPSQLLKMSSYLRSIVKIIFSSKHTPFKFSFDSPLTSFKPFQHRKYVCFQHVNPQFDTIDTQYESTCWR